jgi:hypothetical protein
MSGQDSNDSVIFSICRLSKRKWRILCWNVRGLNAEIGKGKSGKKLMRVNVISYVYRKQNVSILTGALSENFVPKYLIPLLIHRLKERLVVSW